MGRMKRWKLLLAMACLTGLLAGTVALYSPYAPVVEPVRDIEEIWAIEDARRESDAPLVTALANGGVPLGYDEASRTFYCPIGLDNGDSWPQIHLTGADDQRARMVFVDDYTYDSCADAVRDGYSYELMAYTDEEFDYFYIVFTGLPQVCMHTDEVFVEAEIPVEATISQCGQTVASHARSHYRGGATLHGPKKGYRIEFTKNTDGTGKTFAEVLDFGQVENLILIPIMADKTGMRDRLGWDLYGLTRTKEMRYGARNISYVELFVNDSYEGLYLMMEPYDHAVELAKQKNGSAGIDCTYRTGSVEAEKDRAGRLGAYIKDRGYELHYEPAGVKQFAAIDDFIALCKEPDDEAFASRLEEVVDIDAMIHYFLHLQGYAMIDNVFNNMFVIASYEEGRYKISFAPWDLDMILGTPGHPFDMWVYFPPMDRALNLDVGGIRGRTLQMWKALRQDVFTLENVERLIEQYTHELNDSGAAARNAVRWEMESDYMDGYEIVSFVADRFSLLDQVFENIAAAQGRMSMLEYEDYESKYGVITQ